MYLLAVNEDALPHELLEQLDAKIYQVDSCRMQEIHLLLEDMPEIDRISSEEKPKVRVQTFGNFEVFVNGKPMKFYREKSRELFAYLIDRRGASITTRQIAVILWEDEEYDAKLKNKVTRTVSSLKKSLKDAGIGDILLKSWNHLAVDTEKFICDAYDFEKADPLAINAFRGEYMANYSWAEYTNGKYVQMQQRWSEKK